VNVSPFGPTAVIVRFGTKKLEDIRRNIRLEFLQTQRYGLSVACAEELDPSELARRARRPNEKMCVSTVERIHGLGKSLWVQPEPAEGFDEHCLLMFPYEPGDRDLEELLSAFDEPVDNPYRSKPRA
jgi:hypothetical protein